MADSLLAVKKRIQTVNSIKKITKVMKLIASSRYSKYRILFDGNKEYLASMKKAMNICLKYVDYDNNHLPTCMIKNEGNKKLYVYVTSTLGLCGNYFYNLEKYSKKLINSDSDVIFIGEKGYRHYKNKVHKAYVDYIDLVDNLTFERVNRFRHYLDALYKENGYSEVILIYTKYISSFEVKTTSKRLLPLEYDKDINFDELIEPTFDTNPEFVADLIVPHYLDALLYNGFLESALSEQTSRKNSMENATSSADELIYELNLKFNKIRQAKITQEITEVISGSNDSSSIY